MIFLNGNDVKFGRFPNKELNLPISDLHIEAINSLKLVFEDNEDLIKLSLLKEFLDSINTESILYITYMPYSRMDRGNAIYAVSIYAICNFINSLKFNLVTVREPHSAVTMDLLERSVSDDWCVSHLDEVITDFDSICFPDWGSKLRYEVPLDIPKSYGKKSRNFSTGQIDGMKLSGQFGKHTLIIDDMCSRGGTFIEISKLLREKGVSKVGLLVAYVEDNVFTGEMFNYIDQVFTSDERLLANHPRIIKLGESS